jgi:glyoxylase-like metal-dependent hydrolase (beta-lactamase superfamily II)
MKIDHLHCIDLDQPSREGFRKFISSWLYQDDQLTFIVDPGPLSTIPHLLKELRRIGVGQLDYILLTHIHIDHAGGTGALLQKFPTAEVICHPQGIRHLITPDKLWQGSRQVLGGLAAVYGKIAPVPENQIRFAETLAEGRIRVYQTPGHAQHHCCYLFNELLFGGEVTGVHCAVERGIYLRPATPPRFILEVAEDSLRRMIELQPRYLVIAHHGLVEPALRYLETGLNQLRLWVKGVLELSESKKDFSDYEFMVWLLRNDQNFANLGQLAADLQARERYFLGNSLRGMKEYVDQLSPEQRRVLQS